MRLPACTPLNIPSIEPIWARAIRAVDEWEADYAADLFEAEIRVEFRKHRPTRRAEAARAREQRKREARRAAVSATTELLFQEIAA